MTENTSTDTSKCIPEALRKGNPVVSVGGQRFCTPAERALLDALRAIVTDEDADVSGNDVYDEIATFYNNPEWAWSAVGTLEAMTESEEV